MPSLPVWQAVVRWPWHCSECIQWHCQGCGKVIPELNRKLADTASCVPTLSVSVQDLTCHLEKAVEHSDIKKMVMQAPGGSLKEIPGYTEDHVVACNCNSDAHFSTCHTGAGIAHNHQLVRPTSWYCDDVWLQQLQGGLPGPRDL